MSEEEERSSGDESGARQHQRRGRRSGQRMRKEGRRRGEECGDKTNVFDPRKLFSLTRSGSPVIMTECTAAMVLMDLSCSPANRGRMSHASGHSGRRQSVHADLLQAVHLQFMSLVVTWSAVHIFLLHSVRQMLTEDGE